MRPRAAQRVGDVAGDRDLDALQLGTPAGGVDPRQAAQAAAARAELAGLPRRAAGSPGPGPDPAPPSLVALPPIPTITRFAPAAIAASSSSPVPRVVATTGLRRSAGTSTSPDAVAISIAAVWPSPSRPNVADDRLAQRPVDRGLAERAARRRHQRRDRALAAVGHRHPVDRRLGRSPATPRAMASAASDAVRLPLNLSGAITTRIVAAPGSM